MNLNNLSQNPIKKSLLGLTLLTILVNLFQLKELLRNIIHQILTFFDHLRYLLEESILCDIKKGFEYDLFVRILFGSVLGPRIGSSNELLKNILINTQ